MEGSGPVLADTPKLTISYMRPPPPSPSTPLAQPPSSPPLLQLPPPPRPPASVRIVRPHQIQNGPILYRNGVAAPATITSLIDSAAAHAGVRPNQTQDCPTLHYAGGANPLDPGSFLPSRRPTYYQRWARRRLYRWTRPTSYTRR